jgi:hypothetical protein
MKKIECLGPIFTLHLLKSRTPGFFADAIQFQAAFLQSLVIQVHPGSYIPLVDSLDGYQLLTHLIVL